MTRRDRRAIRGRVSVLGVATVMALAGCKDKPGAGTDLGEPAVRAGDLAGNAASAARAEEPAAPAPAPRASIAGERFRAWLAGQKPARRIKASAIAGDIAAELVELGRSLVSEPERGAAIRLRWVKVMSPAAAAFSIGYTTDGGDRVMIFSVAVMTGAKVAARSAQEVRAGEQHDRDMGFAADVDADGDGVPDTVVTYSTGWSGGGHSYTGGLILLGSRSGSTLDVQTEEREAELEGGSPSERDRVTAIQCWTEVGDVRVLIVGGYSEDSYDKAAGRRWDLSAFSADAAGVFDQRAISGRVIAEGALEPMIARRARSGAGRLRLRGADELEAPSCSAPPLVVPDGRGRYRLVTDLAVGRPGAGQSLLISVPRASR